MGTNEYLSIDAYTDYFKRIVEKEIVISPYDDESYFNYTKLNYSRFNRWMKKGVLSEEQRQVLQSINQPITLVVITEPWCGDAAHITPFCFKLAEENKQICVRIQLRDSGSEMERYLTGSSRSIPIVICRNERNVELFHWGPRPKACQLLADELKSKDTPFEAVKIALQQWYNADQGTSFLNEFIPLLEGHVL